MKQALDLEKPVEEMRQIDIIKIYNTKKCLVVDDFPEVRGSLSRMLKTFGCPVVDTAADGPEAVKMCSRTKYDIVICDYNLGNGQDGQQVLEEVRFLRVFLMTGLFVMLTAESSREMVLGALECQPDDYISKPYTEQSLRARLNKAIIRHEVLMNIKAAISDSDYKKAIAGCNEKIKSGSRYAKDCIKLKAQLLYVVEDYPAAKKLYQEILDKRPIIWARIGMGKTLMELNELDAAEEIFEAIVREDDRYIEAHDNLAEIQQRRNDLVGAQKALEKATQVSPKSVKRHRKLAEWADYNGDDYSAVKCHQNAIKWGQNSCHESPQDYFNYIRKVSDVAKTDKSSEAKAMVKQANTFLERAKKRYTSSPEIEAQANMVEAQLALSQGDEKKAAQCTEKAKQIFSNLRAPSTNTSLDYARTLHAMDEEEQAKAILTSLAATHHDDPSLLRVIDSITSEPISDDGKGEAAKLTKNGINAYEESDFAAAINVFQEALRVYPNHIGLNLNLVQAILAQTEKSEPSDDFKKQCKKCMRAIGLLKPDHKQFKRYAFIQKQLSKFYPEALEV